MQKRCIREKFFTNVVFNLSRRIVCVANARTPGGEVKEFEVPKVWTSGETVLAGGRGQLPGTGGGAITPVAVKGQQVFLQFEKLGKVVKETLPT